MDFHHMAVLFTSLPTRRLLNALSGPARGGSSCLHAGEVRLSEEGRAAPLAGWRKLRPETRAVLRLQLLTPKLRPQRVHPPSGHDCNDRRDGSGAVRQGAPV